jgi:toluene monooxygenase system ferredoxin subunit
MSFRRVASVEDLWSGEMMGLEVDGNAVLLINVDDQIYAYADVCPHQRSKLSEGNLLGNTVQCARHQWEFNVRTGQGVNPQNACLKAFSVVIEGRDILLDLDDARPAAVPTAEAKQR